jgi:hypothetical protein
MRLSVIKNGIVVHVFNLSTSVKIEGALIVPLPLDSTVEIGFTYDGATFTPPVNPV